MSTEPTELDPVPVTVTYRNWKGETRERRIVPVRVWFGTTPHHPSPQWFIHAVDVDKGEARDFAMADIGDDRYDRLAQCMGIRPDEVSAAVQGHAPWNGNGVCDDVARERAAVAHLFRSLGLSLMAQAVENGEHLKMYDANLKENTP